MKDKFYNPQKAEKEKRVKEKVDIEKEKRQTYFKGLKKNRNFQKFVVEEILRSHIDSLTNTRNLHQTEEKTKEELADLILANIKAAKTLESILNKLL